ncbi:MAG: response regulator [Ardenticatenaceae bacterium]
MIRVILADDHPALRIGLRVLLEQAPDVTVISAVGDGKEALAQIETLKPDVAVLDCQLPSMSGTEVAATIWQRGLPTRVLALSAYDDKHYVRGMVAVGAMGYLMKEEAPSVIVKAVRAAAQGENWFSPSIMAVLNRTPNLEPSRGRLTPRQLQILHLIAEGKTNRAIAYALGISQKTVEKHAQALFTKLGANSRAEAAVLATRAGLL